MHMQLSKSVHACRTFRTDTSFRLKTSGLGLMSSVIAGGSLASFYVEATLLLRHCA